MWYAKYQASDLLTGYNVTGTYSEVIFCWFFTNLSFIKISTRSPKCKIRAYDHNWGYTILTENIRSLAKRVFWLYTFTWMIVYFQHYDRTVSKSKDRILSKIVYFQSKDRLIAAKWSYTFSFRNVNFSHDRILYVYFSAKIVYLTCVPNVTSGTQTVR